MSTVRSPNRSDIELPDFRVLVDTALDVIMVLDGDGIVRFTNAAARRVLGYEPEAVIGLLALDFVHPDDRQRLADRIREIGSEPAGEGRTAVYRVRTSDGDYRQIEALATNQLDHPGIRGISIVGRDVTTQTDADLFRARAAARRHLAATIARIGTWEWDPATDHVEAEEAVRRLMRQHPDQRWEGMPRFAERLVPEDREAFRRCVADALGPGADGQCLVRLPLPDGTRRHIYFHARRMAVAPGEPERVFGLVMDVTRQKQLEAELTERQEMLSLASWGADLGTWTWYPAERRVVTDRRSNELLGLGAEEFDRDVGDWEAVVHPDDLPVLRQHEASVTDGRSDVIEYAFRVRTAEGGWRWVMDRGRVTERDAAGRATRVTGITLAFDDTARREQRLAEQRLRLELALEASRLGLWDWDALSREMFVDERYQEICGLTQDAVRSHADLFVRRVHPDDRPRLVTDTLACLSGRAQSMDFEGRMLRPDGRLRWVRIQGLVARRSANGQPERLIGTIADNTLRRRTRQLATIGEEVAGVGTYEYDIGDDRFYWSAGTYRIFGLPADFVPARGATLFLVAPSSKSRMVAAFRRAVETGEPFDMDLEARTLDGRALWIRQIGRVEKFDDRVVRVYGIVQDITARKALEAELLEVANREQQRLGSELHDGLGQELTGISLLLHSLSRDVVATRPELGEQFRHIGAVLSEAIKNTRGLAHGLAPVSFGRGGLEGALQVMAEQSTATVGLPVRLELAICSPLRLGEVAGNHLYRIAQEAIGNAVRHGKARSITLRLAATADDVVLEVLDDGIGIPPAAARGSGFGLRSMVYRAQSLSGSCSVEPRPAGGTMVRVTCPQPPVD